MTPPSPLLSVCLVTYNHEAFVRNALEGAVSQRCDFPFEIVIGEDFSTDGTRAICEEYACKYPDTVRLLPDAGRNIGLKENFLRTYNECGGKYISYLEGDDYWTDPLKLQKQVDILEREPDVVFVHTNCKLWNVATGEMRDSMIQFQGTCIREIQSGITGVECEFIGHFRHVKTSTCVYRKDVMDAILRDDPLAYTNPEFMAQDVQLFLDMAFRGRYAFIDEDTTVIALTDSLSASRDCRKALAYRISFHKIGRYYIDKYRLTPAVQQPWLEREAHWFLNFGMQHIDMADSITDWLDQEIENGYKPTIRQKTLYFCLKHPSTSAITIPFYKLYRSLQSNRQSSANQPVN